MGMSPLILAALAKDAVPALDFVQVAPLEQRGDGFFDSACLTGSNGSHYVIKMARGQQAGLVMDT
jgi:macrolide phosphotransferase